MLQSRYDTYVEHLLQEMELTLSGIRDRASHVESWPPLRTLYFGGGTPSLLPILYYEKIFEFLKRNFEFAPDIEITMEMDPGTFGTPEAKNFKELGMTRVSVGVQSFNDDLLKRCGRYHSVRDVYAAVDSLRGAGIYDIGLDLISGLPNQTLELWAQSLKCLIDLKPMHASTYDLEVHPSTKFGKMYKPGSFPLPDESLAAYMYETSIYTLNTAGISHYETSNFAVQGKESEHNQVYWRNEPYYGFGMSAASYVENKRVTRPRSLRAYYAWVEEHAQTNGSPDVIPCSFLEQVGDTLFLGLRQVKGLDLSVLERKANPQICENIKQASQPHIESGLVILENNVLRLHDPKGFLLENHIVSDLLVALEATK